MLYRLSVNPFANQLLLAAHAMDEALDGLGKVRHGVGCTLAGAAIRHDVAQTFDHGVNFTASIPPGGRAIAAQSTTETRRRGGEPVLQIGIESILCLTGLQVE